MYLFNKIITIYTVENCIYEINLKLRYKCWCINTYKTQLLNLIKLLKKNENSKIDNYEKTKTRGQKKVLPMNKEWYNSLYSFNKNSTRFLPSVYGYTFKLIKSYFKVTNDLMENKIQFRKDEKIHRLSGKKIWVSNPEIKHYNDKMNVTIYIYNRTYNFYKKKLDLFGFVWGPLTEVKEPENMFSSKNRKPKFYTILNKLRFIKQKFPMYVGTNKTTSNMSHDYYVNIIKWLKLNKYTDMMESKLEIVKLIKNNQKEKLSILLNSLNNKHYDYLIGQFSKELTYIKFKQKMLFNQFKFDKFYLSNFTKFLEIIYKKKIEWNIVTLKYYHLSTSILLQIIEKKIKNPKFRGKYLHPVDRAMGKIRTPILSRNKLAGEKEVYLGVQNERLNEFLSGKKDHLNQFLLIKKSKIWANKNIDGLVLTNLENKTVSGLFIKIAGRLTRRYRADRALETLRFKGTLKNVYSAHKNLSSCLSRGYLNMNIEKTRIDSKVRIGAFGLTGWMSSY